MVRTLNGVRLGAETPLPAVECLCLVKVIGRPEGLINTPRSCIIWVVHNNVIPGAKCAPRMIYKGKFGPAACSMKHLFIPIQYATRCFSASFLCIVCILLMYSLHPTCVSCFDEMYHFFTKCLRCPNMPPYYRHTTCHTFLHANLRVWVWYLRCESCDHHIL